MSKREKSVNALESPVTEVAAEFPERHVLIKCPGTGNIAINNVNKPATAAHE